jgi:hypothetical protein
MQTFFSLIIPFVLIHHGFNSIALKIISEINSGLKYWRDHRTMAEVVAQETAAA